MKKTYLIGSALSIGILIIVFFPNNTKKMRTDTDFSASSNTNQKVNSDSTTNEKILENGKQILKTDKESKIAVLDAHLDPNELSEDEISEFEDYFEEVEKNWITKIENLFVSEFSFNDEKMEIYMDLRDNYEEEKMIAFQEFNELMVSKYGENYTYTPTKDMEVFENKLEDVYKEKMRSFVGDENFIRYQEVLEEYNTKLRQEQDPDKGIILIEL
jgi:hypothetical protein